MIACPCGRSAETRLQLAEHIRTDHGVNPIRAMGLAVQLERGHTLSVDDQALLATVPAPPAPPQPEALEETPPMPNCKRCGKPGHYAKTCTETPAPRAAKAPKRTKRTGGGSSSKPAEIAKPEPAVPRSDDEIAQVVAVLDRLIGKTERQLAAYRAAREGLLA